MNYGKLWANYLRWKAERNLDPGSRAELTHHRKMAKKFPEHYDSSINNTYGGYKVNHAWHQNAKKKGRK